ncbi:hypothetical protein [Sporosarcina ureae]|uniref:hypothetical protein n=1 Tax=Sporosarcina ureae TaxID=1571 RepID=UPI000A17C488|nr:hypothetical protein [Sporosarcina ureae]ARK20122.1 hypothetical protein SporoP32a_00295 [Sporosarcina ureae]
MATNLNHVGITTTHTYNSNTGTINLKSTITSIVGTKPSIIKTGYHLYHSKTLEGTYTKVGGSGYDIEWTGANIYVGKTHSKDYKVLATNFRMAKATSTAGWTGLGVKTSSDSSKPVLANKKAKIYPSVKILITVKLWLVQQKPICQSFLKRTEFLGIVVFREEYILHITLVLTGILHGSGWITISIMSSLENMVDQMQTLIYFH